MSNKAIEMAVKRNEEAVKDLSAQEWKRLEQLENVVVENFKTFVRVGKALAEIRERKLYRTKAGTFEKYCKELFDIAKSRAYQLIDAADVVENVHNCGTNSNEEDTFLPLNEAQVRPLTKLRPEQQVIVWRAAVESAPNGKITASHVSKVAKQYLGEKIEKTVRRAQEKVSAASSAEFTEAFEKLSQQIIKERNSNYKYTSRGMIVKCLDQLRAELAEDGEQIEDTVFHGGGSDSVKLQKAGFKLFRTDRSTMSIKVLTEKGGWKKHSGPFDTVKALEEEFKAVLQDDMHLRG